MDKHPATGRDGFPRPLPLLLTPFLPVSRAEQAPPHHRRRSLPRVLGDGFIPVAFATIAVASAVILALD
jgi:hypothetical protein